MVFRCHLDSHIHPRLPLYPLQPRETDSANSLKASRLGTRLPDAGTEQLHPPCRQPACRFHHLFLRLGTARAGNHNRTGRINAR
ncbi:hypothetical protein Barb6_03207 [Bacteroidales bacterium Barb6]|nr:hypothetical protein Barb6_03207 [Bacteroidales bacterium Barb6]